MELSALQTAGSSYIGSPSCFSCLRIKARLSSTIKAARCSPEGASAHEGSALLLFANGSAAALRAFPLSKTPAHASPKLSSFVYFDPLGDNLL